MQSPIEARTFYYALVCYFVQVLSKVVSKKIIPKFDTLTVKQQEVWFNKTVSTFHALVMFSRAFHYWTSINVEYQLYEEVSLYEAITIDIMMGYLIYDTIYELAMNPKLDIPTLFHHVIGFVSHYLTRSLDNGSASFYSMMVYLAELSTPFLNISWLLNSLKLQSSLPLTICSIVLVITFFISRVIWGPFLFWHMWNNWTSEPRYLFHINVFIVGFFVVLNFYWFYQLIRVVLGLKKDKKKAN